MEMGNVSTTNLEEVTFGQVDDILVNAEGSTRRITKANFLGVMNDWSTITNKPFDDFDTAYFRAKERADGADILTLSDSVIAYFQAIGNLQTDVIALDTKVDNNYQSVNTSINDISARVTTLEGSSHIHDNKAVIDLFSTSGSKLLWNGTAVGSDYELPIATSSVLGGVKPDGTTITVDEDGTIHGASQGLDFDALSTAMTTGTQSGISITADTENSRFNFEVTGIPTIAIDSEGYWTVDGERGENPTKAQGENGTDGASPTANVTQTESGCTITITDTSGTTTADLTNGTDGANGITPHIDGTTKHWYIGETDTGVTAEGKVEINTDCVVLYANLLADGWSDTAPYTQTVAVTSISADNVAVVDISLSDDSSLWEAENTAYSCLTKVETADGSITATCLKSKPASDFTIKMKVAGDISGLNVVTQSEFDELKESIVLDYSTEETFTGQHWIDGKPLYQKTIVINVDESKTWVRVSLGDGLYNVISNDTIIRFADGSCNIPAPTYRSSGEFASILFTPTTVEAYTANDVYFGTWYATIRYTKG